MAIGDVPVQASDALPSSLTTAHSLSLGATFGSFAGWMVGYIPGIITVIVGLLAMTLYAIQIYESNTVQLWLRTRRLRHIARAKANLAKLEAQESAELRKDAIKVTPPKA